MWDWLEIAQLLTYWELYRTGFKQLPRKNLNVNLGPNRSCWIGKSSRPLCIH